MEQYEDSIFRALNTNVGFDVPLLNKESLLKQTRMYIQQLYNSRFDASMFNHVLNILIHYDRVVVCALNKQERFLSKDYYEQLLAVKTIANIGVYPLPCLITERT
jgi:hypothetical protein